jgi:hypothetical protein
LPYSPSGTSSPPGSCGSAAQRATRTLVSEQRSLFTSPEHPLASHQGGYDDPEDTLDLLSAIADEGTEDD